MQTKLTNLVLKQVGTTLFLLVQKSEKGCGLPALTIPPCGDVFAQAKADLGDLLGVGVANQYGAMARMKVDSQLEIVRPFGMVNALEADINTPVLLDLVTLDGDLPKEKLEEFEWLMLSTVESELQNKQRSFHQVDVAAVQYLLDQHNGGALDFDFH